MAVSFNGTTDYIDMGSGAGSLQLADNAAFSMCCWVNFASIASLPQIFLGYGFNSGDTGYFLQVSSTPNLLVGSFSASVSHGEFFPFALSMGTWHHIYGDYDTTLSGAFPGSWSLYIDGTRVAGPTNDHGPYFVPGRSFVAGAVMTAATPTYVQFFNGCMADPAVFNGPLTGTEITNLANGSLRPNTGMSKTLLGYWKLDTAAATQTDFSVNGNTGTAAGGAITNTCGTSPPYVAGTFVLMGQICA